jgi:hypothetical protein
MRNNFYEIHSEAPSPDRSMLTSPKTHKRHYSQDNDELLTLQAKIDELEQ